MSLFGSHDDDQRRANAANLDRFITMNGSGTGQQFSDPQAVEAEYVSNRGHSSKPVPLRRNRPVIWTNGKGLTEAVGHVR